MPSLSIINVVIFNNINQKRDKNRRILNKIKLLFTYNYRDSKLLIFNIKLLLKKGKKMFGSNKKVSTFALPN